MTTSTFNRHGNTRARSLWKRLAEERGVALFFVLLLMILAMTLGTSLAFFSFTESEAENSQLRYQVMREAAQAGISEAIYRLSLGMRLPSCDPAAGAPPAECADAIQDYEMLYDGDSVYDDVKTPEKVWRISSVATGVDFPVLDSPDAVKPEYDVTVSYIRPRNVDTNGDGKVYFDEQYNYADDDYDGVVDNEGPVADFKDPVTGTDISGSTDWVLMSEFGRLVLPKDYVNVDAFVHGDNDHTATDTGQEPGRAFPVYLIRSVGYLDPMSNLRRGTAGALDDSVTMYALVTNVFQEVSDYAICTCKSLEVKSNVTVDSYDPATGLSTNEGNVGSNGDITLASNIVLTGDARGYGDPSGYCGASAGICGGGTVMGDAESRYDITTPVQGESMPNSVGMSPPCPCESFEIARPPEDIALNNVNNQVCLLSSSESFPADYPGGCSYPGGPNFTVDTQETLVLPPGPVYVTSFEGRSNSSLVVTGTNANPTQVYLVACNDDVISPFPSPGTHSGMYEWAMNSNMTVWHYDLDSGTGWPGNITSTFAPTGQPLGRGPSGNGDLGKGGGNGGGGGGNGGGNNSSGPPPSFVTRSFQMMASPDYSTCPEDIPEVQFRSNNEFYVDYYGPDSNLDINSNFDLYGRVTANSLDTAANQVYLYDDDLRLSRRYKPSIIFKALALWEETDE